MLLVFKVQILIVYSFIQFAAYSARECICRTLKMKLPLVTGEFVIVA